MIKTLQYDSSPESLNYTVMCWELSMWLCRVWYCYTKFENKMLQQLEAVQGGAMRIAVAAPCNLKPPAKQRVCGFPRGLPMVRCRMAEPSGKLAPMGEKTFYKDSWAENFLLGLCIRRLGKITGKLYSLQLTMPAFSCLKINFFQFSVLCISRNHWNLCTNQLM